MSPARSRRPGTRRRRGRTAFSRARAGSHERWRVAAPSLAAALLAALLLAALRVDVIRMRYALATAVARERALLEDQRELTVQMRRQRRPSRLAERARELGFGRPERVIDLPMAGSGHPEYGVVAGSSAEARPGQLNSVLLNATEPRR